MGHGNDPGRPRGLRLEETDEADLPGNSHHKEPC